jgi:hypothetical protein
MPQVLEHQGPWRVRAALQRRRAALQLVHSWRYVRGYGKPTQPAAVRPLTNACRPMNANLPG